MMDRKMRTRVIKAMREQRRKKIWHRVFYVLAAVVVFCTTYALILPAITMENTAVLDCPLTVHTHEADCYDTEGNLICGQADFVVHTHNETCYDGEGRLVCVLPEIEAHEHTDECYEEKEILICNSEESEEHQHEDSCYTVERGDLICGKEEIILHQHTEDCYDEEGTLICGKLEILEHVHDEECFRMENMAVEEETTEAEEPASGEEATEAEEPASGEEITEEEEPASGEETTEEVESASGEETTEAVEPASGEEATEEEGPTAGEETTEEEESAAGEEITRAEEPAPDEEAYLYEDDRISVEVILTPDPMASEKAERETESITEEEDGTVSGETEPIASEGTELENILSGSMLSVDALSVNMLSEREMDSSVIADDAETGATAPAGTALGEAASAGEESGETASAGVLPEGTVLRVTPITAGDEAYDYDMLVWQAEEAAARWAAGIVLYDISFYTLEGEYIPVADTATVSLRFKEAVLPDVGDEVTVLHYQDEGELPVVVENAEIERDENGAVTGLTFQTEGFSTFAVMAVEDSEPAAQDTAQGNSFTLTYNGYTITFSVVNSAGNAIPGDYSEYDIEAEDAARYIFGTADSENGTYEKANIVPKIDGYIYGGAMYNNDTACSVATCGYTNEGTTFATNFRVYTTEPITNRLWYSRDTDLSITLTYYQSGSIIYNLNTPSMSSKGTGWQQTIALPDDAGMIQVVNDSNSNLYAQPGGYSEEKGPAGIENLYRFFIGDVDDLATSPAMTDQKSSMYGTWYGEERFDGWTYTANGVTYLFDPGAVITKKETDGTISVTAAKTITQDANGNDIITPLETEENIILPTGATLTGHWTEVSNVVTFFVNYKGTILDTEGDVGNRRSDTFTLAVAVGHVFYGKQTVGQDNVFGHAANAAITAAFAPTFDPENPNTQIVVEYLRECTQEPTGAQAYVTSMQIAAPGANSSKVADNTLLLLKKTGRTIQIATGDTSSESPNPTIDNNLCDGDHYELRWYVLKEQTNTWHIDGVLVAKTAEITVSKTFSGLTAEQVTKILQPSNVNGYAIPVKLGTDKQNYLSMTTQSVEGQYTYLKQEQSSSGTAGQSYQWILNAITDEVYTLSEENYTLADYDVSTITVNYYTNENGQTQIAYGYEPTTDNLAQTVKGGTTTAVTFNNFYTPTGTGALAITKRVNQSAESDTGAVLPGAVFTLYQSDGTTEVTTSTSNVRGAAYFNNLKDGTYILKETTAPTGYIANTDTWTVEVTKGTDNKVSVTVYKNDVNGSKSGDGTVCYDGGVTQSYTIENTPETSTIRITKTFSGLTAEQMEAIVKKSVKPDPESDSTIPSYYIELRGNIDDSGTIGADKKTLVELYLEDASRSQDGYTFTWMVTDLMVTTGAGEGKQNINYTVTEHNYQNSNYVDTIVRASVNGESAVVTLDRRQDQAWFQTSFRENQSDLIELSNRYTNTFSLKLRKIDSATKKALANAVFKIYGPYTESTSATDTKTYTDSTGKVHTVYFIKSITSGQDGYATIENLTLSQGENVFVYVLDESQAPAGYAAAPQQVVTVTVNDDAISTPDSSSYVEGILNYEAPNTREEDYVHQALNTEKVWDPDPPEGTTVTLELYRVTHNERENPLDEVVDAKDVEKVAEITLDGVTDKKPGTSGDSEEDDSTEDGSRESGSDSSSDGETSGTENVDMTVTVYESAPWVATWGNLYSASKDYTKDKPVHYHYFVREVTVINGYAVSYTCYDVNGEEPDGAFQQLKVRIDGKDEIIQAVLLADMDEAYKVTITNTNHFELPETGGKGTLPYTIGGTLVIAGSFMYGYKLRRKKERRSAQ